MPNDDAPATTGKALRTARLAIAAGLLIGVGVFGVLAAIEINNARNAMRQPVKQPAQANPFGASGGTIGGERQRLWLPGDLKPSEGHPLLEWVQSGDKYPIDHHPGGFKPFRDAAPYSQLPYREPVAGGEVWEFCVYQIVGPTPQQAIAYYDKQASDSGLSQTSNRPTGPELPGGLFASWSDGRRRLEVTASPIYEAAPKRPRLQWVVKYVYPAPTDTK